VHAPLVMIRNKGSDDRPYFPQAAVCMLNAPPLHWLRTFMQRGAKLAFRHSQNPPQRQQQRRIRCRRFYLLKTRSHKANLFNLISRTSLIKILPVFGTVLSILG